MEREQINFYLQQAPAEKLKKLCQEIENQAAVVPIQKATSQTLLVPVHDPITHGTFYAGELLVTSAVIQVNDVNGWAMVMDDGPQLAHSIAMIDGAYGAGVCIQEIEELVRLSEKICDAEKAERNARVNTTRVSFDLL